MRDLEFPKTRPRLPKLSLTPADSPQANFRCFSDLFSCLPTTVSLQDFGSLSCSLQGEKVGKVKVGAA